MTPGNGSGLAEIKLSQNTIAVMIQLYSFLTSSNSPRFRVLGPYVTVDDLRTQLYGMGFDQRFLDICSGTYYWKFQRILPALLDETFGADWEIQKQGMPEYSLHSYLIGLAGYLCVFYLKNPGFPPDHIRALNRALEQDRLRFDGNQLIAINRETIDEPKELSIVEKLIDSSVHDRKQVLLQHFAAGQNLFQGAQYHACIGEWRSFFEELLRGIWRLTLQHRTEFATFAERPSMSDLFSYLGRSGFFDSEEELAFRSSYGFLSAGGHPGIGEKDDAHLSQILALTFGHAALLKLKSWSLHGYTHY